jgi:DNA repair protein RadC
MDRHVYGPPPEAEEKGVGHEARDQEEPAGEAAAVPWVKLERDPERYRRQMDRAKVIGEVTSARAIFDLIAPTLAKEDQEVFLVLAIDARKQCRDVVEVARGGQSRVHVEIPIVMRTANAIGGEMFIVVHNHPTGNAKPSPADRRLTKAIEKAARTNELVFADHVIVGLDQYYSFADNELVKVPRA